MQSNEPADGQKPRSRLEDEVLEILSRTDNEPTNIVRFSDAARRRRQTIAGQARAQRFQVELTGTNLLIACLALAVIAYLFGGTSPLAARLFAVASIAALATLLVRAFVRPESSSSKRWRGRDIDSSPPDRPDWLDRRFRGPKGPRR